MTKQPAKPKGGLTHKTRPRAGQPRLNQNDEPQIKRSAVAGPPSRISPQKVALRPNQPQTKAVSTLAAALARVPAQTMRPGLLQRRTSPEAGPNFPTLAAPRARLSIETNKNGMRSPPVRNAVPDRLVPPATVNRFVGRNSGIQRFTSRVVQAVKFYPNLHPGAVERVDATNIFRLSSFANQYRLQRTDSHGVNVPNQQYNFVRTREGEMLLHSRYRHPSIAEGKQVLYAGEIFFNNGQLEWWSNGSGHYQPYVEDAEQAALPMDQFFSYQQVIKGEHKRRK